MLKDNYDCDDNKIGSSYTTETLADCEAQCKKVKNCQYATYVKPECHYYQECSITSAKDIFITLLMCDKEWIITLNWFMNINTGIIWNCWVKHCNASID